MNIDSLNFVFFVVVERNKEINIAKIKKYKFNCHIYTVHICCFFFVSIYCISSLFARRAKKTRVDPTLS